MGKKKARPTKAKPASKAIDLEQLSQRQASWLISKTAAWLRDNSHLGGRNADGSYHARDLVRAIRSDFEPAQLPDADLEPVQLLADEFAAQNEASRPTIIRLFESIQRSHGAGGMASVIEAFLAELRWQRNRWGDRPESEDKDIQARH